MWQFIITGYLPGSDYQIGLTELAHVAGFLLAGLLFRQLIVGELHRRAERQHQQQLINNITL
jgi:hypothetical protein